MSVSGLGAAMAVVTAALSSGVASRLFVPLLGVSIVAGVGAGGAAAGGALVTSAGRPLAGALGVVLVKHMVLRVHFEG